jgi:heme-degrading monooxygenase HmoA
MAITEIIHVDAVPVTSAPTDNTTIENTIQKAVKALQDVKSAQHFVLGQQIQDKGVVQITSEWNSSEDYLNLQSTPEYNSFIDNVRSFYGKTPSILHVVLNGAAFGPDGPATAKVVEFAQTYFPASVVTPEFQSEIEEDFSKFNEIAKKEAKGDLGLAYGWVLEEQEHEGLNGEKAKCFLVARGWENMESFRQCVKTDAFKEAIPILLAWNAPLKMVCILRRHIM